MKKIILILSILTIIITTGCTKKSDFSPKLCINNIENICFHIEIADNEQEREYGLMNRTSMPEFSGMLFTFEQESSYTFWMKDTLIPLDMIRIDSGLNIVGILEAEPCKVANCPTFNPGKNASYVLELNKGTSKKYNIKVGDKIEIQQ